jgi:hypothetical protein
MFLFFNTTTKTKTNVEIFNKFRDKNEVSVKGEIIIDDEEYIIERKIIRKLTKVGDHTVSNKLEFYKKNEDGTIVNLTGEQRRETETFIASAVGTEEDFLSTILTTGYNLEELIESKPTARGQILTKFLGLESLKIKEEIAKEIFNEWSRKLISNTFDKQTLSNEIDNSNDSISNSKNEIQRLEGELKGAEERLGDLEKERDNNLSARNNDIDKELINTNPTLLQREITFLLTQKNASQTNADSVVVTEPSQFYNEDQHKELRGEMANLQGIDVACRYEKLEKEKLIGKQKMIALLEQIKIVNNRLPMVEIDKIMKRLKEN